MKTVLFVDHVFHNKTRSMDFFLEVLERRFSINRYFLTPNGAVDYDLIDVAKDVDIVVLWQMDFLAPLFISMGKAVVVIPMYDGSSSLPDVHWMISGRARFLNFSLRLHEKTRLLGCASKLARYFPAPAHESKLPDFRELSAFLWERRPEDGITFELIAQLIGPDLASFHVHCAPDIPSQRTIEKRYGDAFELTKSIWFEEKADYDAQLAKANVFVAPRVAEGIGLALLEAMARGMLVLAHDLPTNNEYICSWVNGILFNKDLAQTIDGVRAVAAQVARSGWLTVAEGHKKWIESHDSILDWIDGAPNNDLSPVEPRRLLRDLWFSFYSDLAEYEKYIRRNVVELSKIADVSLSQLIDALGHVAPSGNRSSPAVRWVEIPGDGMLSLCLPDDVFVGTGWNAAEDEWRWAGGVKSTLHFMAGEIEPGEVKLSFVARSLETLGEELRCFIKINDSLVFAGDLRPLFNDYTCTFDSSILIYNNTIKFVFENAGSTQIDQRIMSGCFKYLLFEFPKHRSAFIDIVTE